MEDAFASLIAQGEEIIAAGKPRTPFSALRYREPAPRVECRLEDCPRTSAPASPSAAMRAAYAGLLHELRRFAPASVLFSSIDPGQGTSFTAANLATLWARDTTAENPEEKVLLLEMYCGPRENDTVIDVDGDIFRDAQTLEKYLCSTPNPGLYRLTAAAGNAALDGMAGLWKRLDATFTRIFIDASPAGYNPLFPWLAARANGTALVARKAPDAKAVKKFADNLIAAGGRFMGVIFNA